MCDGYGIGAESLPDLWYSALKTIAEEIFYSLFGIDFVYLVAQWLIGGKDVHEIFTSFLKKLITIGAFFSILLNGHALIGWVINGFKQSGVNAAGQPHTGIGWILTTGWQIFVTCIEGPVNTSGGVGSFLWNMVTSGGTTAISTLIGALVGLIVGIIVILALIYLALEYLAIQLEAALVASMGIIMMGFAGSRWTVQHAEGYLKYALSVGIRLMVLVIWVAFIENSSTSIINNLLAGVKQSGGTNIGTTLDAYANVLIFVLLVAWMAKKLPSLAASVMTGSSSLSGGELVASGVAAAAVVGAAAATGGAALAGAGGGAGALTGAQAAAMDAGASGAAGSLGGGAGQVAGSTGVHCPVQRTPLLRMRCRHLRPRPIAPGRVLDPVSPRKRRSPGLQMPQIGFWTTRTEWLAFIRRLNPCCRLARRKPVVYKRPV